MGEIVSHSNYDIGHRATIQVIASFNEGGDILPLYLKVDGLQLRVLSAKLRSETFHEKAFICTVEDGDFHRDIKLYYHKSECIWSMEK